MQMTLLMIKQLLLDILKKYLCHFSFKGNAAFDGWAIDLSNWNHWSVEKVLNKFFVHFKRCRHEHLIHKQIQLSIKVNNSWCSRCGHYIFALWFVFSLPNLSSRRGIYNTENKNSSADEIRLILLFYVFLCVHCLFLCAAHCAYSINIIANVNFYAVRPEATRIRWNNAK